MGKQEAVIPLDADCNAKTISISDFRYEPGSKNAACEVRMVWIDVASQQPIADPNKVRVVMGFEPLAEN